MAYDCSHTRLEFPNNSQLGDSVKLQVQFFCPLGFGSREPKSGVVDQFHLLDRALGEGTTLWLSGM